MAFDFIMSFLWFSPFLPQPATQGGQIWFVRQALPRIRRQQPGCRPANTGRNPGAAAIVPLHGETEEAFAGACMRLLKDAVFGQGMGARAASTVSARFGMERVAEGFESILELNRGQAGATVETNS
jgi:hypothetical protein